MFWSMKSTTLCLIIALLIIFDRLILEQVEQLQSDPDGLRCGNTLACRDNRSSHVEHSPPVGCLHLRLSKRPFAVRFSTCRRTLSASRLSCGRGWIACPVLSPGTQHTMARGHGAYVRTV